MNVPHLLNILDKVSPSPGFKVQKSLRNLQGNAGTLILEAPIVGTLHVGIRTRTMVQHGPHSAGRLAICRYTTHILQPAATLFTLASHATGTSSVGTRSMSRVLDERHCMDFNCYVCGILINVHDYVYLTESYLTPCTAHSCIENHRRRPKQETPKGLP